MRTRGLDEIQWQSFSPVFPFSFYCRLLTFAWVSLFAFEVAVSHWLFFCYFLSFFFSFRASFVPLQMPNKSAASKSGTARQQLLFLGPGRWLVGYWLPTLWRIKRTTKNEQKKKRPRNLKQKEKKTTKTSGRSVQFRARSVAYDSGRVSHSACLWVLPCGVWCLVSIHYWITLSSYPYPLNSSLNHRKSLRWHPPPPPLFLFLCNYFEWWWYRLYRGTRMNGWMLASIVRSWTLRSPVSVKLSPRPANCGIRYF